MQREISKISPYFKTEADAAQNLIHDFFLTLNVRGPFHRKDFKREKIWEYAVTFWKNPEALYVELNERVEAATSYHGTGNFL